jgi:hypothetical protein
MNSIAPIKLITVTNSMYNLNLSQTTKINSEIVLNRNGFEKITINKEFIYSGMKKYINYRNRTNPLLHTSEIESCYLQDLTEKTSDLVLIKNYRDINKIQILIKLGRKKGSEIILFNSGFPNQDTRYFFTDKYDNICMGTNLIDNNDDLELEKYMKFITRINYSNYSQREEDNYIQARKIKKRKYSM